MSYEPDRQVPDYEPPTTRPGFGKSNYRGVANYYPGVDLMIPPVVSFNRRGSE